MIDIHVVTKFRRKLMQGGLEVWENEDGSLLTIDLLGWKQYEGDFPPKGYLNLYDFLRLTYPKLTKKQYKDRLKEIKATEAYAYTEDCDDFWAYTNHKCNTCQRKCKQSSKVEIVSCPQYEAV